MTKTARDFFDYRIEQMMNERSGYITHWKDLNKNFQPRRGRFDISDNNRGNKRNQLPNNTPLFAKRTLRAGMMTGATSPARPWFKLGPPDPGMADYGPVRGWLDDVQNVMYRVFASSGLYGALPSVYEECGVIGTAVMLQEEDYQNVTRFMPYTVGEYMLDSNGNRKIDTFGREYETSIYQLISKFGIDNVSQRVRNLYDSGNYSSKVAVRHIIEPNEKELDGISVPDMFAYRSIYYEVGAEDKNKFLSSKGYHEFPVHAPRWDKKSSDTYANSCPGMDALGDAFALQVQEKEKGKAIAKMVSPPTVAPASLKNTQISLLPGANNFSDDPNKVFRPIYQVNPRVNELVMDIHETEERINRAFYVDLFLMITHMKGVQPRNIEEMAARNEEKLLQLGPVLENLNDELLDPTVNRTFNMMVRASEAGWKGMSDFMIIPPPPPELEGKELKVEYVSVLAQAQKMVSTGAMERWIGFVGNVAQLKPEVLDKVNGDEAVDTMAQDLGVPNKAIVTDSEVSRTREARAQQEQTAQATALGAQAAESAKILSETDTTGNSLLNDMVGAIVQ